MIQKYFHGIGTLVHNNNKSSVELVVTKRIHLQEYIIPHFIKYPMCGRKQGVLLEFSKILEKLEDKTSLSKSHFIEIIEKIVSLNYTRSVNNLNYLKKKKKWEQILGKPLNPCSIEHFPSFELTDQFIVGLIDGDGCFYVNFLKDAQLSFLFQITGDLEQKPLFLKIKEKFNLGTIQQEGSNTLKITGKNQLRETLIPWMDKYSLFTEKRNHYKIFKHLVILYPPKTRKLFIEMIELGYNMNLQGKRRKFSLQDYLRKYLQIDTNQVKKPRNNQE